MYEKIAEKIYFIKGEGNGRYPYSNSMLIDDRTRVLIDSGLGPNRLKQVIKDFSIDLVLLSHGHEDHFSGNPFFPEAQIAVHGEDVETVLSVDRLVELLTGKDTEHKALIYRFLEEVFQLEGSRVDRLLADEEILDLGHHQLQVLHTPGHSAGHCCFHLPTANLVFLADLDLSGFGPYYGSIDSDIEQFVKSIERVRQLPFELAVSSHKDVFNGRETILAELDRYEQKITEREDKILTFLAEERTLEEIVDAAFIYGKFPEPEAMYWLIEKIMITKHLERFTANGRVVANEAGYRAAD